MVVTKLGGQERKFLLDKPYFILYTSNIIKKERKNET